MDQTIYLTKLPNSERYSVVFPNGSTRLYKTKRTAIQAAEKYHNHSWELQYAIVRHLPGSHTVNELTTNYVWL